MSKPDLADIVDLRFDILEAPPLEKFHGAQCPNLTAATPFCNYITDGANLCAQAHSKSWWSFTACMYSKADPNGDKDQDKNNPLASDKTFDSTLAGCAAKTMQDELKDLRTCTYGEEGLTLRHASAGKTPVAKFAGPVWVNVGTKSVAAPKGPVSRVQWQKDVVAAVCSEYSGEKPQSCSSEDVVAV